MSKRTKLKTLVQEQNWTQKMKLICSKKNQNMVLLNPHVFGNIPLTLITGERKCQ